MTPTTITLPGQLTIDLDRGTVTFYRAGHTVLSLGRLHIPKTFDPMLDSIEVMIDVYFPTKRGAGA